MQKKKPCSVCNKYFRFYKKQGLIIEIIFKDRKFEPLISDMN